MVIGMATTQKVTVTLPVTAVEAIRELVAAGKSDSVSGFVQHAVEVSLDDVVGWGALLAQALQDTGGEMTSEERAWADQVLGHPGSDSAA
jgi:Arc/MetJ-type ribon-helix-helix transcriptional regulator